MIREISIENYKSICELRLGLGRVTVLIGENGCGKTNILEAIALGAATASNKLDHEFLVSRGIRITEPELMRSAFDKSKTRDKIKISITGEKGLAFRCALDNTNQPYSRWINHELERLQGTLALINFLEQRSQSLGEMRDDYRHILRRFLSQQKNNDKLSELQRFMIYAPQKRELRIFQQEGQVQPLGIHGEGLFKLLQVLSLPENKTRLAEIKAKLQLIDWFTNFKLPPHNSNLERKLQIEDKYIDPDLAYFDQHSSHEGFLFLLFYFSLLISNHTPQFFAIDNIETALHPKLCTQLVREVVGLAKKYNKQVIFTTHHPAALNGLEFQDDEQRLVVIYRDKLGHTQGKRIMRNPLAGSKSAVKISETFSHHGF